jgi:ActR/RegA family two-component response regulator/predicted Ser/Thr protein kinase
MAQGEANGPVLLVVGSDVKRLQWLNHHVTSRWPTARVTTVEPKQIGSMSRFLQDNDPDAVIVQVDFASEDSASEGLAQMLRLMKMRVGVYCIVLADRGNEWTAVRTLKSGANDYLPVAGLTRESLLAAVAEASRRRGAAAIAVGTLDPVRPEGESIEVPGYGIVKEIARSNFSAVYLARSERLRRNVVLKVMKRGSSTREREDAERFQREYEIISSVAHRSIAEIHDFGTLPQHLYLAMEYFPCGDFRERLRNPVNVDEALYYLRTIAEALRVIHVFGILHRDLKPANVMLREDNAPVLIDFGLARRAIDDSAVTGAGQILGSPYYISPEQAQGHPVDTRTDLYSLGVMFYEMLTGEKPYVGRSAVAIMTQHTTSPIPRLPAHLAKQQPILDRLMAKQLSARYNSADELLADLNPSIEAVA